MSARLLALLVLIACCFTLIGARVIWSGSLAYVFLVWNLVLAAVPVIAALGLHRVVEAHGSRLAEGLLIGTWLVFLPNAPYIATDLMHLRPRFFVPLWYDVAVLLSCAVTGIVFGYVSLAEVQLAMRRRIGELGSWACAAMALFLSAFGIYLGRFQRWNSWEILTDPGALAMDVARRLLHPFSHVRAFAVTAVYGCALLAGYVVFRLLLVSDLRPQGRRPGG